MTTINVHIKKCGKSVEVEWDSLPENVQEFIKDYGLRQILNDCHSSEKEPDNAFALVEKKLEALKSGQIAKTRGRTSDPFVKWLREKVIGVVVNAKGLTQKAARELLVEKCGDAPHDWVKGLYGKEAEAAMTKFKAAFDKEQKQAKELVGSLGKFGL